MRKTGAFLLGGVGLLLAVGVPIALSLALNVDPGTRPAILVGGMMPGIGVMLLARSVWKDDSQATPRTEPVPPGCLVCDSCGNIVPAADVKSHDPAPLFPVLVVCQACRRYRTKRALVVLLAFLAALGSCVLVVQLTLVK